MAKNKKKSEVADGEPETVKVLFTLSIGLAGAEREEIVEYDPGDVPANSSELEEWIHGEWKEWIWQFIDGRAELA